MNRCRLMGGISTKMVNAGDPLLGKPRALGFLNFCFRPSACRRGIGLLPTLLDAGTASSDPVPIQYNVLFWRENVSVLRSLAG
jgi:hypothetical protein